MRGFIITEDRIGVGREGKSVSFDGTDPTVLKEKLLEGVDSAVRFRAYDDDNILYYEGVCTKDAYDEALMEALRWMMGDAGVVHLRINIGGGGWELFP